MGGLAHWTGWGSVGVWNLLRRDSEIIALLKRLQARNATTRQEPHEVDLPKGIARHVRVPCNVFDQESNTIHRIYPDTVIYKKGHKGGCSQWQLPVSQRPGA